MVVMVLSLLLESGNLLSQCSCRDRINRGVQNSPESECGIGQMDLSDLELVDGSALPFAAHAENQRRET